MAVLIGRRPWRLGLLRFRQQHFAAQFELTCLWINPDDLNFNFITFVEYTVHSFEALPHDLRDMQ